MTKPGTDLTRLALELSKGLCDHLRLREGMDHFGRDGYLPHDFISDFENAFDLLWQLGLAQGARPHEDLWDVDYHARGVLGHNFPVCFKLVPPKKIEAIIANRSDLTADQVEQLVDCYISMICDYGGLDYGRSWFEPAGKHRSAMRELARHGYAQCEGARFRWTDLAIPAMKAAGLWTEAGRPRREIEDEEILAFFEQLPAEAQAELTELAREPHSTLTFTAPLAQKHFGKGWGRHFPVLGIAVMTIGTRLHALLAPRSD